MKVVLEKDGVEYKFINRYHYEYVLILLPVIGVLVSCFVAFGQKSFRRVVNICAYKFMAFMLGGLFVYVFIEIGLVPSPVFIILLFVILTMLWVLFPMYCCYNLVVYIDDAKLYELTLVGYEIKDNFSLSYKPKFILK